MLREMLRETEIIRIILALRGGEAMSASSTSPVPHDRKPSIKQSTIMTEVRPAHISRESGAVIPRAGICEGGGGKSISLP